LDILHFIYSILKEADRIYVGNIVQH
jgi:hypothetical protein